MRHLAGCTSLPELARQDLDELARDDAQYLRGRYGTNPVYRNFEVVGLDKAVCKFCDATMRGNSRDLKSHLVRCPARAAAVQHQPDAVPYYAASTIATRVTAVQCDGVLRRHAATQTSPTLAAKETRSVGVSTQDVGPLARSVSVRQPRFAASLPRGDLRMLPTDPRLQLYQLAMSRLAQRTTAYPLHGRPPTNHAPASSVSSPQMVSPVNHTAPRGPFLRQAPTTLSSARGAPPTQTQMLMQMQMRDATRYGHNPRPDQGRVQAPNGQRECRVAPSNWNEWAQRSRFWLGR